MELALTNHLETNKNERFSLASLRDTESTIRLRAKIFKQAKMLSDDSQAKKIYFLAQKDDVNDALFLYMCSGVTVF